jgi:hypothetical protein
MTDAPGNLPFSAAADRNQAPILEALRRLLPSSLRMLEIAAGTGQHARHFALACPGWTCQPTDADQGLLPVIDARCRGLANVLPALWLDVRRRPWPLATTPQERFDAVYCANMLHISPWSACPALMQGAATHLAAAGRLLLYGPFRQDDVTTAPSNEAFDADLKSRNPHWGLRELSAVAREAAAVGLGLQEVVALPANNLLVVFRAAP